MVENVEWLGRTTFSKSLVEVRSDLSPDLLEFTIAHECGHIWLREKGLDTGGLQEELAATHVAARLFGVSL